MLKPENPSGNGRSLLKGCGEGKTKQASPESSFTDRGLGILVLIFNFLPDKWTLISYQRLGIPAHTAWGSPGLWIYPLTDGGPRGSLWPPSRREILASWEDYDPGCLFLENHSVGPGSLQSPISSSFLLLILPLPAPVLPPQLGGSRGLYSLQVSGHTHRDYPRGDQGT